MQTFRLVFLQTQQICIWRVFMHTDLFSIDFYCLTICHMIQVKPYHDRSGKVTGASAEACD